MTFKQQKEEWAIRRAKWYELHESGLSYNEIARTVEPMISGQAVRAAVNRYKNFLKQNAKQVDKAGQA